jgi:hypothetical protein
MMRDYNVEYASRAYEQDLLELTECQVKERAARSHLEIAEAAVTATASRMRDSMRALRLARGMSHYELGNNCGMDPRSIDNFEKGIRVEFGGLGSEELARISRYLLGKE